MSTFASGKIIGKKQYLDFIIAIDIPPLTVLNEHQLVHGDTSVVIEITTNGRTKFTWVAQKQDDKWTIIAQTISAVRQAT